MLLHESTERWTRRRQDSYIVRLIYVKGNSSTAGTAAQRGMATMPGGFAAMRALSISGCDWPARLAGHSLVRLEGLACIGRARTRFIADRPRFRTPAHLAQPGLAVIRTRVPLMARSRRAAA